VKQPGSNGKLASNDSIWASPQVDSSSRSGFSSGPMRVGRAWVAQKRPAARGPTGTVTSGMPVACFLHFSS